MKPGLWEMTMRVQMPGMPQGMPPSKLQHCYHAGDIDDLRRTLPRRGDCKLTDWKQAGNRVTYKMSCAGDTAATAAGRVTFAGDHYTGVTEISMNQRGQRVHMTQKYNARRIGDCQ